QLRVYRAVAPGQWVASAVISDPWPYHSALGYCDIDQNGRDELYWSTDSNIFYGNTLVFERRAGTATDFGPLQSKVLDGRVQPTPCNAQAVLALADRSRVGAASSLAVFDVAGRLVLRESIARRAGTSLTLPVGSLRAGCYVFRVENRRGQPIATARTVVVR